MDNLNHLQDLSKERKFYIEVSLILAVVIIAGLFFGLLYYKSGSGFFASKTDSSVSSSATGEAMSASDKKLADLETLSKVPPASSTERSSLLQSLNKISSAKKATSAQQASLLSQLQALDQLK